LSCCHNQAPTQHPRLRVRGRLEVVEDEREYEEVIDRQALFEDVRREPRGRVLRAAYEEYARAKGEGGAKEEARLRDGRGELIAPLRVHRHLGIRLGARAQRG
jgi:hypothetical protein